MCPLAFCLPHRIQILWSFSAKECCLQGLFYRQNYSLGLSPDHPGGNWQHLIGTRNITDPPHIYWLDNHFRHIHPLKLTETENIGKIISWRSLAAACVLQRSRDPIIPQVSSARAPGLNALISVRNQDEELDPRACEVSDVHTLPCCCCMLRRWNIC